jgi:uncharacterized protein (TIGR00288 family)
MKSVRSGDGERALAVFIDFENLGLGFQNRRDRFDIHKVLERLVEKGKIVAKKAYADWSRFSSYTTALHEAAIELVEIPRRGVSGKNSADIRLVVDAIDLAYSKDHIDTFVIVSGDSDFSPLVSKLKELGKHVIGMGLADATSDLLRDNCDEFIYYEDLDRAPIIPVSMNENIPERKRKAFALLLESLLALRRENKEIIYSSMIKDTMKRKKPSFNEEYYGYRTFSEFLEDAQRLGLLELEKHKPSGMYIVTRFGLEMAKQSSSAEEMAGRTASATASSSKGPGMGDAASTMTRIADLKGGVEERSGLLSKESFPGEESGRSAAPPRRTPSYSPPQKHAELEEPLSPIDRPLGRALVEEAEWEDDDLDQVPSYGSTPPPLAAPRSKSSPLGKAMPSTPVSPKFTDQLEGSPGKSGVSLPTAPRSTRSATPSQSPHSSSAPPASSSRKATPRGEKRGGGGSLSSGRSGGFRNGGSSPSVPRRSSHSSDLTPPQASAPPSSVESSAVAKAPAPSGGSIAPMGQYGPATPPQDPGIDEEAEFRAGLED